MIRNSRGLAALALVLAVASALAATVLLAWEWPQLRFRLIVLPRARAELADDDFRLISEPLPKNVEALVQAWRDGDRTLLRLLTAPDAGVWIRTAEVMEVYLSGARHHAMGWERLCDFRRGLYELDPEYGVRFHLLTTFYSYTWRMNYFVPGEEDANLGEYDWRFYWSARPGVPPEATSSVTSFLLDVIHHWSHPRKRVLHEPLEIRQRAVDALVAAWGEPAQQPELDRAIRELVRSPELDPELRVRAATRVLELSTGRIQAGEPVGLRQWEIVLGLREDAEAGSPDWEPPPDWVEIDPLPSTLESESAEGYRALTLVDHPRAREVVRRLEAEPDGAEAIERWRSADVETPGFLLPLEE